MTANKMLKERQNKLNQHVILNSFQDPHTTESVNNGFRIKSGMTEQSGRSMVEMLGVLAIVGILSIGAVSGYTTAMKKYKANELLNEASKRAAVIAMQIAAGQDPSIGEFGSNEVGGATFSSTIGTDGKTFGMTLTSVDEGVCEQMKNMLGSDATMAITGTCGDASGIILHFNKDLKRGVSNPPASYSSNSSSTTGGNEQGQGEQGETTPTEPETPSCALNGETCSSSSDCCNNNCNSSGYCGEDGCVPNGSEPGPCCGVLDLHSFTCVSCIENGSSTTSSEYCCSGRADDTTCIDANATCIPNGYPVTDGMQLSCCSNIVSEGKCASCKADGRTFDPSICCDAYTDIGGGEYMCYESY